MAVFNTSKYQRHDPLSYLERRYIRPAVRQTDLLLRQKIASAEDLYSKDFVGHYGCVNAIEFSHGLGQYIASGGDDRRVLLWNVEKALSDIGKPAVMNGEHNSNIFCVAFDIQNNTILSGGNDEQVIVHDLATGETKDVFTHEDAVYGLSPDPTNPSVFASSCDDGRVLIYDMRDSCGDPFCLANYTSSMHSVMYNPVEPRLLATANAKEGVGLWDVRKPRSCVIRYGGNVVQQSSMSVRFNQRGDQLIALRRRLPPVMYRLNSHQPVCEFDHSGYYNSCTMKSISYAGDNDQYVLSGSDEFNLYMWAIPEDLSERAYINSAHLVLKGHRSIVNQVRFNPANHLIISSGVEKVIKVWSPFKLPSKIVSVGDSNNSRERPVYSHEEYINLVLQDGHVMSHDYSHESTDEDPRMMAFFDSLVQRELEGWSSDDSLSSNEEELFSRIVQLSQSDVDSDDSLDEPVLRSSEDEPNLSPFTIAFASVMASQAADGNGNFARLNAALNNAERTVASNQESADEQRETVQEDRTEEQNANEESQKRDISEMVKKKKKEIKETLQRRLKDCKARLSSSSESDVSDSDSEDKSLHADKTDKETVKDESSSKLQDEDFHKKTECRKQTQLKIKRLRSLRQRILNSDSDTSDTELGEKRIKLEIPSTSSLSCSEPSTDRVQFKKLKPCSDKKQTETKDYLKSKGSPDRGPYLQKKTVLTNIEGKPTVTEENISKKGKSTLSVSHKGKKLKGKSNTDKDKSRYVSFEENRYQRRTKSAEYESSDFSRNCDVNSSKNCQRSENSIIFMTGRKNQKPETTILEEDESEYLKQEMVCGTSDNKARTEIKGDIENSQNSKDTHSQNLCNEVSLCINDTSRDEQTQRSEVDKYDGKQNPSCSYTKQPEKDGTVERMSLNRRNAGTNEDEVQPTWTEFKRFKNKLERARRQYREHKHQKKCKKHYSDDDTPPT